MARVVIHLLPLALLLSAVGVTEAGVCGIVNGSFEDDGYVRDIVATEPNGWTVNVPSSKFVGYVYQDWPTEGTYNLTIYSQRAIFQVGDMATVSQDMELSDADQIVFDLKLASDWSPWDPSLCSAVVLIDGDVVWNSDLLDLDTEGGYRDQVCPIAGKYRTAGLHKVSLGLRINETAALWERYYTHWDAIEIKCRLPCGGGALLPGDVNNDCLVDARDLMMMAATWLADVPAGSTLNLGAGDQEDPNGVVGIVNFFDLAVFGEYWLGSSLVQEE